MYSSEENDQLARQKRPEFISRVEEDPIKQLQSENVSLKIRIRNLEAEIQALKLQPKSVPPYSTYTRDGY